MTQQLRFLFLACFIWATTPEYVQAAPTVSAPAYGVVRQKQVLFLFEDGKAIGRVAFAAIHNERVQSFDTWTNPRDEELRWKVSHEFFWLGASSTLLGKTKRALCRDLTRYDLGALRQGKLITHPREDTAVPGSAFSFLAGGPMADLAILSLGVNYEWDYHFDYLPIAEDRVLLFVMSNVYGRLRRAGRGTDLEGIVLNYDSAEPRDAPPWWFRVYHFQAEWDAKNRRWLDGKWSEEDRLCVNFQEPFQVLAKGSTYYFITESGKLYRTGARRILTGRRDVEPVWDDAARPITHFLTDADADRTFLFCKPAQQDEAGVFFEMGPKPEPQPCDLSKVKPSKADEPLKAVLERARFLADHKLLKHPEPPPAPKKP